MANESFAGEPYFRIKGEIQSLDRLPGPGEQAYVVLGWNQFSGELDRIYGQTAPVSASGFPSTFEFVIQEVPDPRMLNELSNDKCPDVLVQKLIDEGVDKQVPQLSDDDFVDPSLVPDWPLQDELGRLLLLGKDISDDELGKRIEEYDASDFALLLELQLLPRDTEELEALRDCFWLSTALQESYDDVRRHPNPIGRYGVADIGIFIDQDGDGKLNLSDDGRETLEPIVGVVYDHSLSFVDEANEDFLVWRGDALKIRNMERDTRGYHTLTHICAEEEGEFDKLEIVGPETVLRVLSEEDAGAIPEEELPCIEYY